MIRPSQNSVYRNTIGFKFISDGGTLTIKLDPDTPLSVASIMENPDPAAYTKDTLGFTATQK